MDRFLRSAAAKSFVGFILSINEAVRDKPISTDITCSPAVLAVLDGLAGLSELVDKKPPVQHALRYGNPAYRCACCDLADLSVSMFMTVSGGMQSTHSCCQNWTAHSHSQPAPAPVQG